VNAVGRTGKSSQANAFGEREERAGDGAVENRSVVDDEDPLATDLEESQQTYRHNVDGVEIR
jgi:hypothetical protein